MKKIISLMMSIVLLFVLIGCGETNNTDENKPIENKTIYYDVTLHFLDSVTVYKAKEHDLINYDSLDEEYIVFGWFNSDYTVELTNTEITGNIDIYAKALAIGTQYKITYNLNGGEFKTARPNKYEIGEVTQLTNPVKETNYTFLGWSYNGKIITKIDGYEMYGDITLDAVWRDDAGYYNITYNVGEGYLKDTPLQVLREGVIYQLPDATPNDPSLYFHGWYLENTFETKITQLDLSITADTTIYAKYGARTPELTYISFIGDSISTFKGYIPSGFECYYPAQGLTTVEETWWHQLVTRLGYNLLMNNSYSGSYVGGTTEWASQNEKRVKYCGTDTKDPDIIVIYMGTNDWAAGRSKSDFKKAYLSMLNYIYQDFGSDTEVFICTMPVNNYSAGFQTLRENLNSVLLEIANEKNLPIIDFRLAITEENLALCTPDINKQNCHPTAYGMTQMANVAYDVIYTYEQEVFSQNK